MYFYSKVWLIAAVVFTLNGRDDGVPWDGVLTPDCAYPKTLGDFSLLSKAFKNHFHYGYRDDYLLLNCTTNKQNTTVILEARESVTWKNASTFLEPKNIKTSGSIFTIRLDPQAGLKYRCIATNKQALVSQSVCFYFGLVMVDPNRRYIKPNIYGCNPKIVEKNEYVEVKCEVKGWTKSLQWKKVTSSGEVPIEKSKTRHEIVEYNRHIPFENLILVINGTQDRDKGQYKCIRRGPKISSTTVTIIVEKATKPLAKITPNKKYIELLEGKRMKFRCSVSGSPKPKSSWFHNGTKEIKKCGSHIKRCTFRERNPRYPIDSGRYSCVANNSEGGHIEHVDVNILVPVRLDKVQDMNTYVYGFKESVDLYCTVARANPAPVMTWKFQYHSCTSSECEPEPHKWIDIPHTIKHQISPPSNVASFESRLTIPPSENSAFYSCRAVNKAASGTVIGNDLLNITVWRIDMT